MWTKVKIYASAIGAALLAVIYALFKVERHKRKEAETQNKLYEKKSDIAEKMRTAQDDEQERERQEIERKADEARKASVSELDDYINGL